MLSRVKGFSRLERAIVFLARFIAKDQSLAGLVGQ
jgi:hypothetical protein